MLPYGQRSAIINYLMSKIPGVRNFVEVNYKTSLSVFESKERKVLPISFISLDYFLSAEDANNNKYMAIYPYQVSAGFDLDKSERNDDGKLVLQSKITSVDGKGYTLIRDDIKDMDYDIYIKGFRIALEKIARDTALKLGLREKAEENFSKWYSRITGNKASVNPGYVFGELKDPFQRVSLDRYDCDIVLNKQWNIDINENKTSPYLFEAQSGPFNYNFSLIPDSRTKGTQLFKQAIYSIKTEREQDNNKKIVIRVYDPFNTDQGGVIAVVSEQSCEAYTVLGSETLAMQYIPDNLEVIDSGLSQGIYIINSSRFAKTSNVGEKEKYLSDLRSLKKIYSHLTEGKWNSVLSYKDQIKNTSFSDLKIAFAGLSTYFGNGDITIENLDSQLSDEYLYLLNILKELENSNPNSVYPFISREYLRIESILRDNLNWNDEELSKFYKFILSEPEIRNNIKTDDRERFSKILHKIDNTVSKIVWDTSSLNIRKLIITNYLLKNENDNYRLTIQNGEKLDQIFTDNVSKCIEKSIWWYVPYYKEKEEFQIIDDLPADSNLKNFFFEKLDPPVRNGIIIMVPNRKFIFWGGKINALVVYPESLEVFKDIKKVMEQDYDYLYRSGPIPIGKVDADKIEKNLEINSDGANTNKLVHFIKELVEAYSPNDEEADSQYKVQFHGQIEKTLRHYFAVTLFPMPGLF